MKTLGQFLKINEDIFDVDIEKIKYKKGDQLNKTLAIKSFWRNRCCLEGRGKEIYIDYNTSLKLLDLMVAGITTIEIVGPVNHLNIICDEDLDFKGLTIHYNGYVNLGNTEPINKKQTVKNLNLEVLRIHAWSPEQINLQRWLWDDKYDSKNKQLVVLDNVSINTKIIQFNYHRFNYIFNDCNIKTNLIWVCCGENDKMWKNTKTYDFSDFKKMKFKEISLFTRYEQKIATKQSFLKSDWTIYSNV